MLSVNADEVLKVRRPLLQDDENENDALAATQSASSEAQQTANDQQLLKCDTPSVDDSSQPVPATDAPASSLG